MVDSYIYVGVLIHRSLSDEHEIDRRILMANKHVGFLRKKVLGNRTTHISTKKLVYEGMVLAILMYGAETWILSKRMEMKLTYFHRRIVRLMANVNRFTVRKHRITAYSLEKRLQLRSARDYIDSRILGYAGHIARMPPTRWPRLFLHLSCTNPGPVDAPPATYLRQLSSILARKNIAVPNGWIQLAQSRERWRRVIQAPTPTPTKTAPVHLPGQRICLPNQLCGTVLGLSHLEIMPTWKILLDRATTTDLERSKITRLVIPDSDQLEWCSEILKCPLSIIGRAVQGRFKTAPPPRLNSTAAI